MAEKIRCYDDIIHLPHHQSETRSHMPVSERAAQFSPFAALNGFEEAIKEAARYAEQEVLAGTREEDQDEL